MTERSLTFDGTIHNLNSNLQVEVTVPQYYFGEEKKRAILNDDDDDDEDDDDDDADDAED